MPIFRPDPNAEREGERKSRPVIGIVGDAGAGLSLMLG
jgi:hypothetical protein